jgi:hypothetical protein
MRYTGKDLYVEFQVGANTHNLSADYRTLTVTEEIDLEDSSAGSDTHRNYLPTLADTTLELEFLDNTTNNAQFWTDLNPGVSGTLIWGPEGNSAGKTKYSVLCVVSSVEIKYPYDGVVEVTVEFQAQNWITRSTW